MPNTELTPLDVESVTAPSEKGKSKLLLAAYEKAAEHHDLKYFKEMLVDHQKAIEEDQEAQAEKEAKKANKAKRKSTTTVAAPVVDADEMDIDEDAATPKPKSKKRKKDHEDNAAEEKVGHSYIISVVFLTTHSQQKLPRQVQSLSSQRLKRLLQSLRLKRRLQNQSQSW